MRFVTEAIRARAPYKAHKGKFIVDIGYGLDPNKHDYCAIIQENGKFVVLVMHGKSVAAYDGNMFINKDYSYPLNHRRFQTTDEAYNKMMKWIGKMVKKDDHGRYYNNRRYHEYDISEDEFDINALNTIADKIKREL